MANPTVTSVTYSPVKPSGGYPKGTQVDITAKFADVDSKPAVPARSSTIVIGIVDLAGNTGTKTETIEFAPVPELIDLDTQQAFIVTEDDITFQVVARTKDTITWRFVA